MRYRYFTVLRYLPIFLLRYCGIGYPPMSPSQRTFGENMKRVYIIIEEYPVQLATAQDQKRKTLLIKQETAEIEGFCSFLSLLAYGKSHMALAYSQ